MLKVQLHTHTSSDERDRWISYSDKELIDRAAEKNFDVLSITCHQKLVFSKELSGYAEEKNILLIPGIEARIEGCDILIINADKKAEELKTFKDLKKYRYKNPDCLIVAPHPYHKIHSLGKNLIRNIKLFDAVEYSFFYSNGINPNKKAEKLGLPVLGTADIHFIDFMETTYSYIDAEKDVKSVIKAVKKGKIRIETKPLTIPRMARLWLKMGASSLASKLVKRHRIVL